MAVMFALFLRSSFAYFKWTLKKKVPIHCFENFSLLDDEILSFPSPQKFDPLSDEQSFYMFTTVTNPNELIVT